MCSLSWFLGLRPMNHIGFNPPVSFVIHLDSLSCIALSAFAQLLESPLTLSKIGGMFDTAYDLLLEMLSVPGVLRPGLVGLRESWLRIRELRLFE